MRGGTPTCLIKKNARAYAQYVRAYAQYARAYAHELCAYARAYAQYAHVHVRTQRGMVFLFFGYHIQNCRSSQKIGRKEIILRFFFFSLGIWHEKKNGGVKSRD